MGYICGGKLYADIKAAAAGIAPNLWSRFERPGQVWHYVEWADRRGSWKRFSGPTDLKDAEANLLW